LRGGQGWGQLDREDRRDRRAGGEDDVEEAGPLLDQRGLIQEIEWPEVNRTARTDHSERLGGAGGVGDVALGRNRPAADELDPGAEAGERAGGGAGARERFRVLPGVVLALDPVELDLGLVDERHGQERPGVRRRGAGAPGEEAAEEAGPTRVLPLQKTHKSRVGGSQTGSAR
jgi:hypothetical protein